MYAIVTSFQMKPGQASEFLNRWNGLLYPILRSLSGVSGGYVLTNPDIDKALSVIFYQTEADAAATQISGKFREMIALIAPTIVLDTVIREGFEVNIQV